MQLKQLLTDLIRTSQYFQLGWGLPFPQARYCQGRRRNAKVWSSVLESIYDEFADAAIDKYSPI
jgi:hypothetical protein